MKLYTERHGIRAPLEKTYVINSDVYALLLKSCVKYKENLIHIFPLMCHHDFTDKDYIKFDDVQFSARIRNKIRNILTNHKGEFIAPNYDEDFDQFVIIDLIEYFAQNIRDITKRWNSLEYKNFEIVESLSTSNIFLDFQTEINEIFLESGVLYNLTSEKIVERIVEDSPLTNEIEDKFREINEAGLKELLKDAVALHKTPNDSARRDSVEKIWDAFERLKTYYESLSKKQSIKKIIQDISNNNKDYIKLLNDEFNELTRIGNEFRIRHHETNKIEIYDVKYYDYFFNRCLSLIALAVKYLK